MLMRAFGVPEIEARRISRLPLLSCGDSVAGRRVIGNSETTDFPRSVRRDRTA